MTEVYNYYDWHRETDKFIRFQDFLKVGQPAPDFEATTLDGRPVRLSDFYRERPVLLEFGSIT